MLCIGTRNSVIKNFHKYIYIFFIIKQIEYIVNEFDNKIINLTKNIQNNDFNWKILYFLKKIGWYIEKDLNKTKIFYGLNKNGFFIIN